MAAVRDPLPSHLTTSMSWGMRWSQPEFATAGQWHDRRLAMVMSVWGITSSQRTASGTAASLSVGLPQTSAPGTRLQGSGEEKPGRYRQGEALQVGLRGWRRGWRREESSGGGEQERDPFFSLLSRHEMHQAEGGSVEASSALSAICCQWQ
ncbi:hypothetical protein L7F22_018208 [Adiantum nelumboides]|nr:hypothetical protein [Adiantum nelumboides]